jgi:hypothetical protein
MKKLVFPAIAVLPVLSLAGCGSGEGSTGLFEYTLTDLELQ